MTTPFKAIRNTDLPHSFRQIRLELAREPGHPEGDHGIAYVLLAPLDGEGRIDAQLWQKHRDACRVARLRPDAEDERGHLVHRRGGSWAFTYDVAGASPDESGYHFSNERFVPGEYVSIKETDGFHAFRVAAVTAL
jgi:hypothetical protein